MSVFHDSEFLFLQYFHPADFQNSSAKYVKERLDLIIKIEEFIVPNLGFSAIRSNLHILNIFLDRNPVSEDWFFRQGVSLGCEFVPGWLISEGLDEFVCEDLNICSFV